MTDKLANERKGVGFGFAMKKKQEKSKVAASESHSWRWSNAPFDGSGRDILNFVVEAVEDLFSDCFLRNSPKTSETTLQEKKRKTVILNVCFFVVWWSRNEG